MRHARMIQRAPWPGQPQSCSFEQADNLMRVQLGDRTIELEISEGPEGLGSCIWRDRRLPFAVARQGPQVHVWLAGESFLFDLDASPGRRRSAVGEAAGGLVAQVPGKVLQVLVREGERVEAGQRLVVIESMKMEFVVRAKAPGTVKRILVAPGAQVVPGAPVVEMEEGA